MTKMVFPCEFIQVHEWGDLLPPRPDSKTKCGKYTSTVLPIKGYGTTVWSVVAYIKVNYDELREQYSDSQIIEGCVNFLNTKPPRKRKLPYGLLKLDTFTYLESKKVFSVRLLIEERNHKSFWGKGWMNK